MTDKLKVLVTGATGFVGSAVVKLLDDEGFVVGEIARQLTPGTRRWAFDLTAQAGIPDEIDESFDVVVHCAGLAHQFGETDPREFQAVNVDGAANAVRLAVKCRARQFVHISSVAVYGDHGTKMVDESFECRAVDPYALSKLAGERAVAEICGQEGMSLVILRPATVIGSGDRGNTARLIRLIGRRRFFRFSRFANQKTLIANVDLARAVQVVIAADKTGTFNVAAPPLTMASIVESISNAAGVELMRLPVPEFLVTAVMRAGTFGFWPPSVRQLGRSLVKFLSDDCFSAEKFDETFGKFAYTDVRVELARQTAAQLGRRTTQS